MAFAVLAAGLFLSGIQAQSLALAERPLPEKAQIIDQKSFNVLEVVPPPQEVNATTVSLLCMEVYCTSIKWFGNDLHKVRSSSGPG